MLIDSIAYNHNHGADFCVQRPDGIGCMFFLLVKAPTKFVIDGVEQFAPKNTAVIFNGTTPCSYSACTDDYTEDWFYAHPQEEDFELLRRLNIPMDTLLPLNNAEEISQLIHVMVYEHYSAAQYHEEIEYNYLKILFAKLSRLYSSQGYCSPCVFADRNAKLSHLHTRMYNMPQTIPDIDGMALELGMSRSGLQHLYKRYFGVSITKDVINGRIEYAKRLLSITELPLADVAEQCGYGSVYHFMKQFKSVNGKTPTEFRSNA